MENYIICRRTRTREEDAEEEAALQNLPRSSTPSITIITTTNTTNTNTTAHKVIIRTPRLTLSIALDRVPLGSLPSLSALSAFCRSLCGPRPRLLVSSLHTSPTPSPPGLPLALTTPRPPSLPLPLPASRLSSGPRHGQFSLWSLTEFSSLPVSLELIRLVLGILPFGGPGDLVLWLSALISVTPLSLSERPFRMEVVLAEKRFRAGVNRQGPGGLTPLMLVAFRPRLVRLLLSSGADPQLRDYLGRTFLQRVLSSDPLVVPLHVLRSVVRVSLAGGVAFQPWDKAHPLRLVHPNVRRDDVMLRMLREAGFVPGNEVSSLASLARRSFFEGVRKGRAIAVEVVQDLGRVRTDAGGNLSMEANLDVLAFLGYEDLAVWVGFGQFPTDD